MQKIETPEQAKEYIESSGIEIEPGQAYSLFTCGCVSRERSYYVFIRYTGEDRKKHKRAGYNIRCCREHKTKGIYLGSFKKCKCGALTFSKNNVRSGGTCPVCQAHIRATRPIRNKILFAKRNIKKRDLTRADCRFRIQCLDKYDGYQALPCKNCKHYWPQEIEEELTIQGGYGINKYEGFEAVGGA